MPRITLTEACELDERDTLACVGAGGKTTTCWRLWEECRARNQAVVFSTSTNIWEPILPTHSVLMLSPDPDATHIRHLLNQTQSMILACSRRTTMSPNSILVPNSLIPELPVKLKGLSPEQFDQLFAALPEVTWLIEADGARGHGLKIPAEHEPQIPSRIKIVIIIMHLDTIGQALNDTNVHRAEHVAEFLQVPIGTPIRAEHIIRILSDPRAALKNMPASARVFAMLNQRDTARPHREAQTIAEQVLATQRYERVIDASLRAENPILKVWTR